MRITKLSVQHLRCIEEIEIAPGPRLNWLVGPNGAGKTTLLEALHLLSHGHSFRAGAQDSLIRRGSTGFSVYAEIENSNHAHALGMARDAEGWRLRLDGRDVATLAPLLEHCAAICFDPSCHALIAGPAEERRRFLDWGVFHVEHESLMQWRHYRRALRQRNALLRTGGSGNEFEIWETELERMAEPIVQGRENYLRGLQPVLFEMISRLLPELGEPRLGYQPGWDTDKPLSAVLAVQRERDAFHGHTRSGPHRADWKLSFEHAPVREHLSRGQTKITALACILAQGALFADHSGEWPILCLDDLVSELDFSHQELVFDQIARPDIQVWIATATMPDTSKRPSGQLFHVEHGHIRPAE